MTTHPAESGERRPDMNMTALIVTGGPAGAIVAAGLVLMGLVGLPEFRLFFVTTLGLGVVLGAILWWKHR
jgi:hypothetical protein